MPTTAYTNVLNLITSNLPTGGTPITAADHRAVEQALLAFAESQWLTGDIKEIDCTNQYISQNFDANGIGINEREGWAICNGYNGLTRNRTGRVSVAYGNTSPLTTPGDGVTVYTSVGNTFNAPVIGGSKDAVVVSHTHPSTMSHNSGYTAGGVQVNPGKRLQSISSGTGEQITATINNPTGSVPGTDKNMQPYIVTLFIQKL
jgi:hypothetical protein